MTELLTRDAFREGVFARDGHKCVVCGQPGQDAHHIIERRLFPDGGYYLGNGATLCGDHHMRAEETVLTCEEVRDAAGIKEVVLPPHLYRDHRYDKWGNPILENGQRLRGELFEDESVRKVLASVLHEFTDRVKYPRTWHLPWSPGVGEDDRVLSDLAAFAGRQVVVTEKMDGENTSLYSDYVHARSIEYKPHASRSWIKAMHAKLGHEIPKGWRVCGENLYARHSLSYENLQDYFLVFSIWNERNECVSWSETVEWAGLLGFKAVPVLYHGTFDEKHLREIATRLDAKHQEGYVLRIAESFHYRDFRRCVGKYVRADHVQTHGGWMRAVVKPNKLAGES